MLSVTVPVILPRLVSVALGHFARPGMRRLGCVLLRGIVRCGSLAHRCDLADIIDPAATAQLRYPMVVSDLGVLAGAGKAAQVIAIRGQDLDCFSCMTLVVSGEILL